MDSTVFESCLEEMLPIPTGLEPKGEVGDGIKCILFDIYGTLFISGSGDIGSILKEFPWWRGLVSGERFSLSFTMTLRRLQEMGGSSDGGRDRA